MENSIITMKSQKFGSIRKIYENGKALFCGADVAKALGYSNTNKAINDHCRAITKRSTPISGKIQEINFIPEADVYRLICHSKLPSALEFEKWVFEDVVPKAVSKETANEAEQLMLETSEYHYFDKTYKGQPVLSIKDITYYTGISNYILNCELHKSGFVVGKDHYRLEKASLREFKAENPNVSKVIGGPYHIVTKSGFIKLMKNLGGNAAIPKCFENVQEKTNIIALTMTKEGIPAYRPNEEMNALMEEVRNKAQRIQAYSYLLTDVNLAAISRMYRGELRCEIQRLNMMIDKIDNVRF